MTPLLSIILATIVVSLGSLVALVTLAIDEERLHRLLLLLVAMSAGALMGSAFLHILPEASRLLDSDSVNAVTLLSFIFFFIIEKFFFWHHSHQSPNHVHGFGYLNIVGNALHNILDGLIIAATFMTNPQLGVVTTIAIAFHEIPHEIGDFGVLMYAGFRRSQAIVINILISVAAVLGGIIGYFMYGSSVQFEQYLLPVAAGGFIYIAASDLLPEIRKETNRQKSLQAFALFLLGVLLMFLIKLLGIV